MNDFATLAAAGAPAPDADTAYAAALDQAMSAETPQARAKAVDALEAMAEQRSEGSAAATASAAKPGEPSEGLEGGTSPLAYTLENALPPGVEVVDRAGLTSLKTSLFEIGVPPEIATAGFGEIAQLGAAGVFASDAAYD